MSHLFICHDCDLANKTDTLPEKGQVICRRCGALLARGSQGSLALPLILSLTGLIVFVIANCFPFLGFQIEQHIRETYFLTGVVELYVQGMWLLATIVLFTVILAPFLFLAGMCAVLFPLYLNRPFGYLRPVLRYVQTIQSWMMIEVFMLGILVALVKLSDMADILPGISLYAFMVLIFLTAGVMYSFNAKDTWDRLEAIK